MIFSGHQPTFIPYMGFFYKLFKSDVFVLDDDVQFSRTEYQNFNFLKIQGEKKKITVPVSCEFGDKINWVRVLNDPLWVKKVLNTIRMSYGRAPFFDDVFPVVQGWLLSKYDNLAEMNIAIISDVAEMLCLGSRKIVVASCDVPTDLRKNDRNVFQCKKLGCDTYYSGNGGRAYNDVEQFKKEGIEIIYSDYEPVRYKQVGHKPFIENLSVVDYLFNEGCKLPENWRR